MLRLRSCRLPAPACLLFVVMGMSPARSDDPKDTPAAPTALQIAQWIKDLDSDDFKLRQQATGQLIGAGKQAAAQVAKAAEGESAEVTARCLDVLSKLLKSADIETKAEAKKALEGLTKSKNSAVAGHADKLLNPAKADDPRVPGGAPRVIIGGIGVAGPGMRISTKTVDGNKTIEAVEGGKTTKIEESAKGDIKMEITETVDGKEKTSKFEAKTAEELKKNHPEGHALYEKYSKFAPGVRIGGVIGGGLPIGPGGIAGRAIRIGAVPQKALDQIEEAKKQLEDATAKLRKLAEESRISPAEVKKLAEQFEAAKEQLDEARAVLPK